MENNINLNLESIANDFEIRLVIAIKQIFPKIACWMTISLYASNHMVLLKGLDSISFLYYKDIVIINIIFNRYINLYKKEIAILYIPKDL